MKYAALLLAFAIAGLAALPARADLIGQPVDVSFVYPDVGSILQDQGVQTISSGGATYSFVYNSAPEINTLVTPGQIEITNVTGSDLFFDLADFNGIQVSEVGDFPDAISGVSLDAGATTLAGAASVPVTFDASDVYVNLAGVDFSSGAVLAFDLTFSGSQPSGAPEPASLALAATGLAAVTLRKRRQRRSNSKSPAPVV